MKKIILFLSLIVSAMSASAQSLQLRLDSLMEYYNIEYGFNGSALIAMKGKTLVNKGYGYKDISSETRNSPSSIYRMASITKEFTSEVILQLAMAKKIGLQDKLTQYFPGYPNGDKITIENLLTHTSGIHDFTGDSTWLLHITEPISKNAFIGLFRDKPQEFEPGSKFEYSNSNYVLLGYIIEKVTGKKYEQVVRENILIPCHMTHSGFDYTHLNDKNKTTGYESIQANYNDPAPVADSTLLFAAGGLYSTTGDMYKWYEAIKNYKLLPKEWQDKAFVIFKSGYGYGWMVGKTHNKLRLGHTGGIPGYYTYQMHINEDDLCILLFQNCKAPAMDNNSICIKILSCIYDTNYHMPMHRVVITMQDDMLKQFTGEYIITDDFSLTVSAKKNVLYIQGTGQEPVPVDAMSETKFFSKDIGAEVEFFKDSTGNYNKLVLFQGGQKVPAIRKK